MRLKKRRTEIAFELEQTMIVKRRSGSASGWCNDCALEVVMLTPDEAASITSTTTRALYRLVDAGTIHFTETEGGLIRLCFPSVLQAMCVANQDKQFLPKKASRP
jgi:hypothetical protein